MILRTHFLAVKQRFALTSYEVRPRRRVARRAAHCLDRSQRDHVRL